MFALLCDSAAAVMAAAAGARGGNGYGEQASPDVVTPYSYVILRKAPSPRYGCFWSPTMKNVVKC